jgi:signal recognition particle receptor subunit beta
MVLINKAINEVTVKLVYYGPGLCGKTTNLEKIYANPKLDNKGKMISMSTETDRTLFFDFMPMELGTIAGQKVRVQLYTVPGQVFYDATRKLVLRGADGVVFVADSQASMRDSNLDSLNNLETNLRINRIDPDKIAVVYQLNKRDLPNVASVEEMKEYLHAGNAPVIEATAINGGGVTATLRAAVAAILDNLKNNVDTTLYDAAPLTAPDMSQRSGVTSSSAGTPKLSMKTEAPRAPEPFAAPAFDNPFDMSEAMHQADDDPFAHVAVALAEPETETDTETAMEIDDPFAYGAAQIHDADAERAELEELLANARAVVASLETALERARENERVLSLRVR